jgi:putative oxidoreductase
MNWFGNQKGEGFEYHLLAIGIAIVLIIRRGGKWAADTVIENWLAAPVSSRASA